MITSGLTAGEKVVVEGLQKIKSGAPVTAKPWTPPTEKAAGWLHGQEEKPAEAKAHAK